MKHRSAETTTASFERALAQDPNREKYILRLYVSGMTSRATAAIQNIQNICEQHLPGRYELEIIDVYQQPTLAKGEQIIAAPTLIKKLPLPLRRFIGDMSKTDKILLGLDLRPAAGKETRKRGDAKARSMEDTETRRGGDAERGE
jgi:circadian clock protein KaiB